MRVSDAKAITSARPGYGWVIIGATFLIYTTTFGVQYSFGIFFKPLQEAFGWPRATTSWVLTLHLVCYALCIFPAGWAIERFGARRIFTIGALLVGGSLALCSRVSQTWQIFVLYSLLLGMGIGIYSSSVVSIVTRWFSQRRGLALGIASSGIGFGTLAVAPLSQALISRYGWQNALGVLGVTSCVILLICASYMKASPPVDASDAIRAGHQRAVPVPGGITIKQAIRMSNLYLLMVAQFSAQFAVRLVMAHFAPHATDLGMSAPAAALAVGLIGGFSLTGRLAMGFVQDRIGARLSMIVCLSVLSLCMLALPLLNSSLLLFAFAVPFGFMYGGDVPQGPAITAQCFGTASIVVIYGTIQAVSSFGAAVGPVVGGYIFDVTGSYTVVFLVAAATLVIGVICAARLKLER